MAQVDFYTMLSGLGDTIAAKRKEAARREAFQSSIGPDGSLDFQKAVLGLTRVGDTDGALRVAQLANAAEDRRYRRETDARDFSWRQQEAQRAQANLDRAANREKFTIKEDPNTGQLVRVKTEGAEGPIGGVGAPAPNNPFSSGGKFNNEQGKAAGFTDRMLQSEGILSGIDGQGGVQSQGADIKQTGLSKIPYAGNFLISGDRQKFEQAKRDFINAQLRRESGAAISPSEFENADKQYFPVPGDSEDTIKQKAANRRASIEAMGREGGASYRPKFTFSESGSIIPYKAAPAASQAPADPLQRARDAIARGASREAVIKRLVENGINPSGL